MAARQAIDWSALGFSFIQTRSYIQYTHSAQGWDTGKLHNKPEISLHLDATVLHYGQSCFEGLKAFEMADGKVRIFRPRLNARRLQQSCRAVSLEAPSEDLFMEALERVIKDNRDFVPPYGSNGSLYIRPFVFGSSPEMGLSPARETTFIIFVNPVGDYYPGGIGSPVKALIQHGFDRAAPQGTGSVKVGGNYAPCLGPSREAKAKGYTITLFLDAKEHQYIEEFSSSNFAALTAPDANGKRTYVTPKSNSILPSVTNRSLTEVGRRLFGWNVERREIPWTQVKEGFFDEVAACGTAAIITPVGQIDREIVVDTKVVEPILKKSKLSEEERIWEDAPVHVTTEIESVKLSESTTGFRELYNAYRAIQTGDLENWESFEWMWPVEGFE